MMDNPPNKVVCVQEFPMGGRYLVVEWELNLGKEIMVYLVHFNKNKAMIFSLHSKRQFSDIYLTKELIKK
jgi:hypothetical protein